MGIRRLSPWICAILLVGTAASAGLIVIPAGTFHDRVLNSTNDAGTSDTGAGAPEGAGRDEDWLVTGTGSGGNLGGSPLTQSPASASNNYWNTVTGSSGNTGILVDSRFAAKQKSISAARTISARFSFTATTSRMAPSGCRAVSRASRSGRPPIPPPSPRPAAL